MPKVKRERVTSFENANKDFIFESTPLVGDILQTERVGPEGYIPTGNSPVTPAKQLPIQLADGLQNRLVQIGKQPQARIDIDLKALAQYERSLIAHLGWGQYTTYVLVGDMGSGKTTSANFALEYLAKPRTSLCATCAGSTKLCEPVIIRIDFNRGFTNKDVNLLVKQFQKLYSSRLRAHLRELMKELDAVIRFVEWVTNDDNRDLYSLFDSFAQEYQENAAEWRKETAQQRSNRLFRYIDKQGDTWGEKLELSLLVARFLGTSLRRDRSCFAVLLDNLDSVAAPAQHKILLEILARQEFAGATTLVPMRHSTFDDFKNNAAYSFGIIHHAGVDTSKILCKRLESYESRVATLPQAAGASKESIAAIEKRIDYTIGLLKSHGRVPRRLRAFSGVSVRHGLYLAERFFLNNTIPWDRNPANENEVTRALMVGVSPDLEIPPRDPCVANIYSYPYTNRFSLVTFRLLQLLFLFRDKPLLRRVDSLMPMLEVIGGWSEDDFMQAANYLMFEKRPLAWVDGREEYKSTEELYSGNETLNLTFAGLLYWRVLLLDIEYFQETTVSLDWPEAAGLPESVNYGSWHSRFGLILNFLKFLQEMDKVQTGRFERWATATIRPFDVTIQLASSVMVYSLGRSIMIITSSISEEDRELRASLLADLRSIVVQSYNADRDLKFENTQLKKLEGELRSAENGDRSAGPDSLHDVVGH